MHRIILVLFLFGVAAMLPVRSQQVDFGEAETVAMNIASKELQNSFAPYYASAYSISHQNIPVIHVFNLFPEGFVVISGNRKVIPLLAWSDKGSCPEHGANPAFEWWMNQYAQQIYLAGKMKFQPSDDVTNAWEKASTGQYTLAKTGVAPLLNTTWGQDHYYNEFCPEDPSGPDGKCVTGCVATAIGQLMNYFRWPLSGTGSYTSEDTVYGTLSVDFSAAEYRYNEMAIDLTRSSPETAELIHHLGVSVDMHYGPYGSGMNNHKAAHTMKTFFRYADSTRYIFRDSVSFNWDSVVVAHLDRGLPMYYAGWSDTNYISGHAFVVDGYQGTDYFHFNWGWNGSYDGYFYTSNLTPGGADFTLMHELVINMEPSGIYPVYCSGTDTLKSADGTIDDGSGPLHGYQNNSDCFWLIAPDDSVTSIQLEFLRFATESANDVLTVYDGPNMSAPVLGTFSGSTIPSTLQSDGNSLLLHFHSNSSDTSAGFLIAYQSISPSFCSSITTLTSETDTIGDGSNQFDYHGNSFCRWKIEPASGMPILLTFTEFDMDSTDYVRVIDHSTGDLLGEYRGDQLPPVHYSANGKLTIYFKTSATGHSEGFTAHYRTSAASVAETEPGQITLFPNPASEYVCLTGFSGDLLIRVVDFQGRLVLSHQPNNVTGQVLLPVHQLSNGIYQIMISDGMRETSVKFYKQSD